MEHNSLLLAQLPKAELIAFAHALAVGPGSRGRYFGFMFEETHNFVVSAHSYSNLSQNVLEEKMVFAAADAKVSVQQALNAIRGPPMFFVSTAENFAKRWAKYQVDAGQQTPPGKSKNAKPQNLLPQGQLPEKELGQFAEDLDLADRCETNGRSCTATREQRVFPKENARVDSEDATQCIVCMDGPREVVFCPCGHLCCCRKCDLDICPLCRKPVTVKQVVYYP